MEQLIKTTNSSGVLAKSLPGSRILFSHPSEVTNYLKSVSKDSASLTTLSRDSNPGPSDLRAECLGLNITTYKQKKKKNPPKKLLLSRCKCDQLFQAFKEVHFVEIRFMNVNLYPFVELMIRFDSLFYRIFF